jgi:hypothetical protein
MGWSVGPRVPFDAAPDPKVFINNIAFPLSFSSGPDQEMALVALENITPMRKAC